MDSATSYGRDVIVSTGQAGNQCLDSGVCSVILLTVITHIVTVINSLTVTHIISL